MTALGSDRKNDVLADSVLRAAGMSVDDIKSLGHIFKDAAAQFCDKLRHTAPCSIDVDVSAVEPFDDDSLNRLLHAAGAVTPVRIERWGCTLHIIADHNTVFGVLEALFGAQGNLGTFESQRPLTALERKVADLLFSYVANALNHVFGGSNEMLFRAGDAEDIERFDHATLERDRLFTCALKINIAGKTGYLYILLPRSSHRPMQDAVATFLRRPMAQNDPAWTRKMRQEVSRALIHVEAFIQQGSMTLADLANLELGHVLKLPADAVEQVRLRSANQPLYKCTLGKSGMHFTIKLGDPVNEEEDLIDELVAG